MYRKNRLNSIIDIGYNDSNDRNRNNRNNKSNDRESLETSYGEWIQVCYRVSYRRANGQTVVVLCTSEDTGRASETMRQGPENLVLVKGKWTSGMLTNTPMLVDYIKTYLQTPDHLKKPSEKRHYERYRKDLQPWLRAEDQGQMPSRRRCRDAERHQVARKEARRCGVPSVGVYSSTIDSITSIGTTKMCTYHVSCMNEDRTHLRSRRGRRGEASKANA